MSVDPLGPSYVSRTLDLPSGAIGTLVRHRAGRDSRGAVLYLHGYIDYFFHGHLAEHFAQRGYDFYAVDLRRCGRSLRPGDAKFYATDLAEWDEELDAAVEAIRADGHENLVMVGHSTGGLAMPLWLAQRRDLPVSALILNSPWLDLQAPWVMRTLGTQLVYLVARFKPDLVLPQGVAPAYGDSVHASAHGEWDYDTDWKPLRGAPMYAGVLAAVRRGQARVHQGLGLGMPILLLHSERSRLDLTDWEPAAQGADVVLDVEQMKQWADRLGPDVTTSAVPGGVHDLFLSAGPARAIAFAAVDGFLDRVESAGR
ncbi:MAG: alpha/beta hydrolase [Dermatophilaceae bacterium]